MKRTNTIKLSDAEEIVFDKDSYAGRFIHCMNGWSIEKYLLLSREKPSFTDVVEIVDRIESIISLNLTQIYKSDDDKWKIIHGRIAELEKDLETIGRLLNVCKVTIT